LWAAITVAGLRITVCGESPAPPRIDLRRV
jgi:hypothetical protein